MISKGYPPSLIAKSRVLMLNEIVNMIPKDKKYSRPDKEKQKQQRNHANIKLYGWFLLIDRSDANLLWVTEVDLPIPPEVEKTRGVNEASSTSRILCS